MLCMDADRVVYIIIIMFHMDGGYVTGYLLYLLCNWIELHDDMMIMMHRLS